MPSAPDTTLLSKLPQYTEDLSTLEGFKIGVDADTLLRLCTQCKPLASLQAVNASIDSELQANLVTVLRRLASDYKLKICIVMSGMCPPQLLSQAKGLERSYYAWNQESEQKLFAYVLNTYGAGFYQ